MNASNSINDSNSKEILNTLDNHDNDRIKFDDDDRSIPIMY